MVNSLDLLKVFIKVGALGFGGPYALLTVLEKEVVQRRHWLTPEEFSHSVALGTLTPGPVFFSTGVHVGYRLRGVKGALIAGSASLLPGFAAAVAFAALYVRVETLPAVTGAARGLTAGVAGLLALLAIRSARPIVNDWRGAGLALITVPALLLLRANPVWVILGAALVGIVAYGKGASAD